MKKFKKLYYNIEWHEFADRVRKRDGLQCVNCQRDKNQVVLQVHHKRYIAGLKPWEYSLSDCITLCKGCHAREHNLLEPNTGWTLIVINDLGELSGVCEREGCGTDIRYEHKAYHPNWGYKIVGSSCIEFLTEEDKSLCSQVLNLYKNISNFVHKSNWITGHTGNGNKYIETTYSYHRIRIYGTEKKYAFQVAIKRRGVRWFDWNKIIDVPEKNLNQVKELAYIVAKGKTTDKQTEKLILRNIYKEIK